MKRDRCILRLVRNDIRQCEEERKNLEILKYLRNIYLVNYAGFFNEIDDDLISWDFQITIKIIIDNLFIRRCGFLDVKLFQPVTDNYFNVKYPFM